MEGSPDDAAVQPCPLAAKQKHWVEIELLGEDDRPIPWENYEVTLPAGNKISGFLNGDGKARVASPDGGSCTICFPDLDAAAWDWYSETAPANGDSQ